jgi:uncharacterized protein YjiS (DUF1127 family)
MSESGEHVAIPLRARLLLARAAVQVIADHAEVDLLHIKGDAVDAAFRDPGSPGASGTDVDVLVRPAQVARMDRALRAEGWMLHSTFTNGSPFGHAQTYLHGIWGYLDLHRSFPGIEVDAAEAFEVLWQDSEVMQVAAIDCRVPAPPAQALILVLNAARSLSRGSRDVTRAWDEAAPDTRAATEALAGRLGAEVAVAAATGRLEDYRGRRSYRLWRAVSQGGTRTEEWLGRVIAAQSWSERRRVISRLPLVNTEHLGIRLGHHPSAREIAGEFFARPARAVHEWIAARRTRRRS